MILLCKQVNIKLVGTGSQQQRISSEEITSATHLKVSLGSEFVNIFYVNDKGEAPLVLKLLSFNKAQVVEVDCTDSVRINETK